METLVAGRKIVSRPAYSAVREIGQNDTENVARIPIIFFWNDINGTFRK